VQRCAGTFPSVCVALHCGVADHGGILMEGRYMFGIMKLGNLLIYIYKHYLPIVVQLHLILCTFTFHIKLKAVKNERLLVGRHLY
jgi:hypothetical protein